MKDSQNVSTVLIADRLGFVDVTGEGLEAEVREFIESKGAHFHEGSVNDVEDLEDGVHFFYMPDLDGESIAKESASGKYDMINVAATQVPEEADFPQGGVRWGAGTNNFPEAQWEEAGIPLMNVPAGNSVRTALTWQDALVASAVDLDVKEVQERILTDENFTTVPGINDFPTEGLEGKRIAILGITGNIGHEVSKISDAFHMEVVGWSSSFTEQDAEDMGVLYASTMIEAAQGADIISPHLPLNDATKGSIDADVINAAKSGFTLINFARGEIVDPEALEEGLRSGQIGKVAVDADITRDEEAEVKADAPLKPYLDLQSEFGDKMLLLPHIATDTDHQTRVGLAKRGVDQSLALLQENTVINSVQGVVPEGYEDGGTQKPPIGKVSSAEIVAAVTRSREDIEELAKVAARVAKGDEVSAEDAVAFQRVLNKVSRLETTGRTIRG